MIPMEESVDIACNGDTIHRDLDGWVQVNRFGPANNRNVEVARFHSVFSYSNDDGDTWGFREVGVGHVFFPGDEPHVRVSGRSFSTPFGGPAVFGQFVLKLSTGEVAVTGHVFGVVDDAACAALTA